MRLLVTFLCCLFAALSSQAQERVRNVRVRAVDSSQLDIRYDLINTRPGDSVYFTVLSRVRGALRISPEFVRGDVGIRITAGSDRRIVWDALANGYSLNEEIQARVFVKTGIASDIVQSAPSVAATQQKPVEPVPAPKADPVSAAPVATAVPVTEPKPRSVATTPPPAPRQTKPAPARRSVFAADSVVSQPTSTAAPVPKSRPQVSSPAPDPAPVDSLRPRRSRYNGPAWALVSAVAPGIGNIFVQTPKPRIGLRPLVTVGCYGLFIYGLMERQKAQDEYSIYEQQKNMAAGEPYYQTANGHHHRYFMATRGAVVVAAADVILTFIKGLRNTRMEKERRQNQAFSLRPGLQAGQPTAVVRYSF